MQCSEFDRNKDPNNLKLHIFHHYIDHWKQKVRKIMMIMIMMRKKLTNVTGSSDD